MNIHAGKLLPISVLAGIVICLAVSMIGADAFEWPRSGRIVIYELRGNPSFATADCLSEELQPDLERPSALY